MPISSLPGKYGIGTLGKEAREFADILKKAGQSYWQILPVGPTSYGDSPYQSFSTYAGNPYFIDLDALIERGYLKAEEIPAAPSGKIDYGFLYETRFNVLNTAAKRAWQLEGDKIREFLSHEKWVDPYARFMALKTANGMCAYGTWQITEFDCSMQEIYDLFVYIQYEFYRQWFEFKTYVNDCGIRLIGDIPIYVSADSADLWQDPSMFLLDEKNVPRAVSGVPPDYFSEDGQLWGNPLYDYEKMKENGYSWWIDRIGQAAKLYDVIRIDHFRGFASFWAVPYGEKTARFGKWEKGPGIDLVGRLTSWFQSTEFIAEDLGVLTPDVEELLKESGLPGMKVLEFAFDGNAENPHLPHNYTENTVCYTGTHDNSTLKGWMALDKSGLKYAKEYMGIGNRSDYCENFIRLGMASVAKLFIAPVQDWLSLGDEARMNTPGTLGGNWTWRLSAEEMNRIPTEKIREMTGMYGRLTTD